MAGSSQNLGQHYNNSAAVSGPSRLPNPATDADREQEVRYIYIKMLIFISVPAKVVWKRPVLSCEARLSYKEPVRTWVHAIMAIILYGSSKVYSCALTLQNCVNQSAVSIDKFLQHTAIDRALKGLQENTHFVTKMFSTGNAASKFNYVVPVMKFATNLCA